CLAPRSAPNPPLALPDEIAVPHPSPTPSAPYQAAFLPTTVPCSQASYFLRLGPQNPGNHLRHAVPVLRLALQPFSSCCRQPVIFRLPLILRFAPLARNPTLMFQPVQRRIERPLLDLQPVLRDLLDSQQHTIAMQRPERYRFEDQHVQCPWQ